MRRVDHDSSEQGSVALKQPLHDNATAAVVGLLCMKYVRR